MPGSKAASGIVDTNKQVHTYIDRPTDRNFDRHTDIQAYTSYTCMHTHTHGETCMRAYGCFCGHTHTRTYTPSCIHGMSTYIPTYVRSFLPVRLHTYAYLHTCMGTYVHTYTHAHIYIYVNIHRHTYLHTCLHTYLCTYVHTDLCAYIHA